jgi:hypothetical protein
MIYYMRNRELPGSRVVHSLFESKLCIYLPKRQLLPMFLTNLTAMQWAIDNMNATQIKWLSQRDWDISTKHKPNNLLEIKNHPWVYEFCIFTNIKNERDLMFAQLIFSDCRLETV